MKIRLTILFLLLLFLAGCKNKDTFVLNPERKIEDVVLMEIDEKKQDLCLVTVTEDWGYADNVVPNRYLVLTEGKGVGEYVWEKGNPIINQSYNSYNINVYSIETKELVKTYNLKEMEAAMPEGYALFGTFPGGPRAFRRDGEDYLLYCAVKYEKKPKEEYEKKSFTINLDTDEMKLWEEIGHFRDLLEDSDRMEEFDYQISMFHEWTQEPDPFQFLKVNGFLPLLGKSKELLGKKILYTTGWYTRGFKKEGIAEVKIPTDSLPVKNEELYTKFPGLKEYQGKEGLVAIIFLENFPSNEEIFQLFLEDGQEISFEGCVMDGKHSKDGEPHEIRSFEEFEEWYRPAEK